MDQLLAIRDIALLIAREVAAIPADAQPRLPGARTMGTSTKSSEVDLVTELDQATEAAIVRELAVRRPQDGVLGEEGAASASQSGFTWVVDPIDGTVNYFYGWPQWAISLGVTDVDGQPVVGVVHAPALNETYVAARGHGAFFVTGDEWTQLSPPPEVDLPMALLATGFSYDRERRLAMARAFADLVPRVRDFRRAGAASLDICGTAAGRVNGYYERDLKPWDRVAGFAVAAEVGLVTSVVGDPLGANLTLVATPRLAETLRRELASSGVVD